MAILLKKKKNLPFVSVVLVIRHSAVRPATFVNLFYSIPRKFVFSLWGFAKF